MAKTRMMTQKGECYLCGALGQTEEHHCFGGPNRRLSEKYGLKVYLCLSCHRTGPNAVHDSMNGTENRKILHEDAQRAAVLALLAESFTLMNCRQPFFWFVIVMAGMSGKKGRRT